MQEIPNHFRQHLNQSLLGRLKLKLLEQIVGNDKYLPDAQQFRHYISDQYRSNTEIGMLFGLLLNLNQTNLTAFDELHEPTDLKKGLLGELEENPLEESFFLEIAHCPEALPQMLGAFVYCRNLAEGGYVYVVTLIDESEFPELFAGRSEIRASRVAPEPAFSVLGQGGYTHYSLSSYQDSPFAVLMVKVLNFVNQNRFRSLVSWEELPKAKLRERQDTRPPSDWRFQVLLKLVTLGKISCAEAEVELSLVKPHDLDFCLAYPMDVVNKVTRKTQMGLVNRLLVYWYNNAFIMSDSYPHYLAYRKLGHQKVPIVIMGPFPKGVATPIKVGGTELIPPVTVAHHDDYSALPPELKDFLMESRLKEKPVSEAVLRLYSHYLRLSSLIQDTRTKEKQLHEFLLKNPIALDPYGLRIEAEVQLGQDYRVDLVIQYAFTDKRLLLIELERASLPIFTKKGRPRAQVTHATQQVEDWLRWWKENPSKVPAPLDSSIPAEGLVVIGRNVNMDEDAKRRLLNLNHNRRVKVITYDDLLDRVENLIINLEKTEMDSG